MQCGLYWGRQVCSSWSLSYLCYVAFPTADAWAYRMEGPYMSIGDDLST